MLQAQSEEIEETLWVAIRMLEERRNLLITVADHANTAGQKGESTDKRARAEEINIHIDRLKGILQTISLNEPND